MPEYYNSPWRYYCEFIEILIQRGAKFIRMIDMLDGNYLSEEINILLDHHIDFYPIETHIMCKWELEYGVISNVYLFNNFNYLDTDQKKIWSLKDLDLEFYKSLERNNFEIGYHQNAVGQVRVNKEGRNYNKTLSQEDITQAKEIFSEDIKFLRKHFNIRTFIPHGAGEANNQLFDLPKIADDLVWVYNNNRQNNTVDPGIKWRNFSDSVGVDTQKISGYGARMHVNRDNLHVKAYLSEPGLNHVLVHAGRMAKDMPYELYKGEVNSKYESKMHEFEVDSEIKLPVSSSHLIDKWINHYDSGEIRHRLEQYDYVNKYYSNERKYYVLSDDIYNLLKHLATKDTAIPFFLYHHKYDGELDVYRGINKPKYYLLPTKSVADQMSLIEASRKLYNEVYCPDIFKFLVLSNFPFKDINLKTITVDNPKQLRFLKKFLTDISMYKTLYIELNIKGLEGIKTVEKELSKISNKSGLYCSVKRQNIIIASHQFSLEE